MQIGKDVVFVTVAALIGGATYGFKGFCIGALIAIGLGLVGLIIWIILKGIVAVIRSFRNYDPNN